MALSEPTIRAECDFVKPGDLVKIADSVKGSVKFYKNGEFGIVIEMTNDRYGRRDGLARILVDGHIEDFSIVLLEIVNEAG